MVKKQKKTNKNKTEKPALFEEGGPGGPGRPKMSEEERLLRRAAREKIERFLETNGLGAAGRVIQLSKKAKNEKVRLSANQDVLDRIGIGASAKNPTTAIQINFGTNDQYA